VCWIIKDVDWLIQLKIYLERDESVLDVDSLAVASFWKVDAKIVRETCPETSSNEMTTTF